MPVCDLAIISPVSSTREAGVDDVVRQRLRNTIDAGERENGRSSTDARCWGLRCRPGETLPAGLPYWACESRCCRRGKVGRLARRCECRCSRWRRWWSVGHGEYCVHCIELTLSVLRLAPFHALFGPVLLECSPQCWRPLLHVVQSLTSGRGGKQ